MLIVKRKERENITLNLLSETGGQVVCIKGIFKYLYRSLEDCFQKVEIFSQVFWSTLSFFLQELINRVNNKKLKIKA